MSIQLSRKNLIKNKDIKSLAKITNRMEKMGNSKFAIYTPEYVIGVRIFFDSDSTPTPATVWQKRWTPTPVERLHKP